MFVSRSSTLVIRPGALGDAILTLPALAALRASGTQTLTVLGTPSSWAFLQQPDAGIGVLDFGAARWLPLFSDPGEITTDLKAFLEQFKRAVVWLCGDTQLLQAKLKAAGVNNVIAASPPVTDLIFEYPHNVAIAEWPVVQLRNRHAARELIAAISPWIKPEILSDAVSLPVALRRDERVAQEKHFAIHPGSGGRRKCWPAEFFANLAARIFDEFGLEPIVSFGPADEVTQREFFAALPARVKWQAFDSRPLIELFQAYSRCRFAVANDSGVAHLAARATPTLAIFGPTEPERWAPVGEKVMTIQAAGGDLSKLSVEAVFEAVTILFDGSPV